MKETNYEFAHIEMKIVVFDDDVFTSTFPFFSTAISNPGYLKFKKK